MKHLEQKFQEVFGIPAEKQFFAPGRVNLIGEHTVVMYSLALLTKALMAS